MSNNLDKIQSEIIPQNDFIWCFDNYKQTILKISEEYGLKSFLEIGGGRSPLLSPTEIEKNDITYTINDISQKELDRAPEIYHKACFDISNANIDAQEKYDFIFSKMVFEHIKDTEEAYKNIFAMLKPGGIFLNFHPTLYCSPFILNYILPETTSRKILQYFKKIRHDEGIPKFPAYYNRCNTTKKTETKLKNIGFSEVNIIPFYGHAYYRKIPILNKMTDKTTQWAMNENFKPLASYAYTVGQK